MTDSPEPPASLTRPPSGLPAVRAAVDEVDAVGFVHVGGRADPALRYLTRVDGPDRETAVVFLSGDKTADPEAVYCVPNDVIGEAATFGQIEWGDEINRRVAGRGPTTATGQQIVRLLDDRFGESTGTLLVPRTIPHDTAVFLRQAGYELQSTPAVATARATKTPAERDCLRAVQEAATAGMARAEAALVASEPIDGELMVDGRPLTTERLRRRIDAELASLGVEPAASTRIEAPTAAADRLPAGEPIRIHLAPRGPHGYRGHLTRTVAVDSRGGWERRAFIAAEAGLRAAARQLEPGVDVSTVETEAIAEVGAYGFAVASDENAMAARAVGTADGIGLSAYEFPVCGSEGELTPGSVIAVETGVDDPEHGSVRLGTLFGVSTGGAQTLVEYPSSLSPVDRLDGD